MVGRPQLKMVHLQSRRLFLVRFCKGLVLVWCYLVFSLTAWMMEKRICRLNLQLTPSWVGLAVAWLRGSGFQMTLYKLGEWCEKDNLWFDEDKHKVLQNGRNC